LIANGVVAAQIDNVGCGSNGGYHLFAVRRAATVMRRRLKEGHDTTNVRRSHRSTRKNTSSLGRTNPWCIDECTGCGNVSTRSIVRKRRPSVLLFFRRASRYGFDGGRYDADGRGRVGGREVAGVGVTVSGRNYDDHTGSDAGVDGGDHGWIVTATEGHVGVGGSWGLTGDVLDTADDGGGGTATLAVQNFYGSELDVFGDTVFASSDYTGDVGAVSMAIGVVGIDTVEGKLGTTAKIVVLVVNTGINDVRGDGLGASDGILVSLRISEVQDSFGTSFQIPFRVGLS